MKRELINDDSIQMWMEDGIFCAVYKVNKLEYDFAKKVVEMRLAYNLGESYPSIVDLSPVKSVTKEAREYCASDEASVGVSAAAMITGSVVIKWIATFFLNLNKPAIPIKIFTDQADAVKWIKTLPVYKNAA